MEYPRTGVTNNRYLSADGLWRRASCPERVNDFETPMHINLVSMDRVFSSASSPAWVG